MRRTPSVVAHADWSAGTANRAVIVARRHGVAYHASLSLDATAVMRRLLLGSEQAMLGFDFPIGLPRCYAALPPGIDDFAAWLRAGPPPSFFQPAATRGEIGRDRPFYPARSGGTSPAHLSAALGLPMPALRRDCDRITNAACMFWTMGAQQCGKAALAGWQLFAEVAAAGARPSLWPFDGGLDALVAAGGPVIVETYPRLAYCSLGLPRFTKSRQDGRASVAGKLSMLAERYDVTLDHELRRALEAGFPADRGGDHAFDALVGLILMVAVCRGDVAADPPDEPAVRRIEGWMLGLTATPRAAAASPGSAKGC